MSLAGSKKLIRLFLIISASAMVLATANGAQAVNLHFIEFTGRSGIMPDIIKVDSRTDLLDQLDAYLPPEPKPVELPQKTEKPTTNTNLSESRSALENELAKAQNEEQDIKSKIAKVEETIQLADSSIEMAGAKAKELQSKMDSAGSPEEKLAIAEQLLELKQRELKITQLRSQLQTSLDDLRTDAQAAGTRVAELRNSLDDISVSVQTDQTVNQVNSERLNKVDKLPSQANSANENNLKMDGLQKYSASESLLSRQNQQKDELLKENYSEITKATVEKISIYAPYSRLASAAKPESGAVLAPPGWKVIESKHNVTGLDATVFQSDSGEVALVFHGTDLKDFGPDLITDIEIGSAVVNPASGVLKHKLNPQFMSALSYAKRIKAKHPNTVFVGHSLGGALAQYTAGKVGGKAIVFDSAPLAAGTKLPDETIKFRGVNDPLTIHRGVSIMNDGTITIPTDQANIKDKITWEGHKMDPLANAMTSVEKNYERLDLGSSQNVKQSGKIETIIRALSKNIQAISDSGR